MSWILDNARLLILHHRALRFAVLLHLSMSWDILFVILVVTFVLFHNFKLDRRPLKGQRSICSSLESLSIVLLSRIVVFKPYSRIVCVYLRRFFQISVLNLRHKAWHFRYSSPGLVEWVFHVSVLITETLEFFCTAGVVFIVFWP